METGYDILFFWVARMIMMGLENTGDIPFGTVYLHGLVRDEKGEKMSKVRGNVLNPVDTLEKYGTDALRFALSTGTAPGNDIKLAPVRLEAGRNFANKLWNATRFVIRSLPSPEEFASDWDKYKIAPERLPTEDRWILSRLGNTISNATKLMEDSQFGEAQRQIHDFLWGEFCDWYIEIAKIRLRPGDKETVSPLPILAHVLETSLRLLHPFMPFITEELWQRLKRYLPEQQAESIMIAPYPEAKGIPVDPKAERIMESIIEIIRSIRNARAQYKVERTKWVEAQIYGGKLTPAITPYSETIQTLARAKPLAFLDSSQRGEPMENALALVLKETEVVIPMESMVDLEAERKRLQQEIEQIQAEVARLEARLKDKAFLTKAPAAVVDKEQNRLSTRRSKLERLKQQLIKYQI
jgi:valyl-tRNA synthetase